MSAYPGAAASGPAPHEEWAELVVGRALDALEPGDDALLDAHLPSCPECEVLLSDMRHIAASLAYGAEDQEPPAELLDRIRAALPAPAPVLEPVGGGRVVMLSDHAVARRANRRRPAVRRAVASVAGLSVAAALVVTGGYALHVKDTQRQTRTALASEASVIHDLSASTSYSVTLSSKTSATGAAIVDGNAVDLVTAGLAKNDTHFSTYVLWAADKLGDPMKAVGTFDVTAGGVDVVRTTLPAGLATPTVFGVTREQGRTAPATPGPVAVLGIAPSA